MFKLLNSLKEGGEEGGGREGRGRKVGDGGQGGGLGVGRWEGGVRSQGLCQKPLCCDS